MVVELGIDIEVLAWDIVVEANVVLGKVGVELVIEVLTWNEVEETSVVLIIIDGELDVEVSVDACGVVEETSVVLIIIDGELDVEVSVDAWNVVEETSVVLIIIDGELDVEVSVDAWNVVDETLVVLGILEVELIGNEVLGRIEDVGVLAIGLVEMHVNFGNEIIKLEFDVTFTLISAKLIQPFERVSTRLVYAVWFVKFSAMVTFWHASHVVVDPAAVEKLPKNKLCGQAVSPSRRQSSCVGHCTTPDMLENNLIKFWTYNKLSEYFNSFENCLEYYLA